MLTHIRARLGFVFFAFTSSPNPHTHLIYNNLR